MADRRFVLDASVAVEWFLPGGGSRSHYAESVLEQVGAGALVPVVPDLWHYELGSVLVAARRDQRISAAKLQTAQRAIRALGVITLAIDIDAPSLIDLSRQYHLQGYDAVYFELARRLKLPIASVDGGIVTACAAFGVEII